MSETTALTATDIFKTVNLVSLLQTRFFKNQEGIPIKQEFATNDYIMETLNSAYAVPPATGAPQYKFFDLKGQRIWLSQLSERLRNFRDDTFPIYFVQTTVFDDTYAATLLKCENACPPDISSHRNLIFMEQVANLNVFWRCIFVADHFWKTPLDEYFVELFSAEHYNLRIRNKIGSFSESLEQLRLAVQKLDHFKDRVPENLKLQVPPAFPDFFVSSYAAIDGLKTGSAPGSEQDWTRRLYAVIVDSLFVTDDKFVQKSNRQTENSGKSRPDHTIEWQKSPYATLPLLLTEDSPGRFSFPGQHKDFSKLVKLLRTSMTKVIRQWERPEDIQIFGMLFGGPQVCVLRMTCELYRPYPNDDRRRPTFRVACGPVWDFSSKPFEVIAPYMSCLAKIYSYAKDVVANLKETGETFHSSNDLKPGTAVTGGLKKSTDYPTSLRITTLSTQDIYVDPTNAVALALGDVNLDDDADEQ